MQNKLAPNILVIEENKVLNTTICNTIERYGFDSIRAYEVPMIAKLTEFNSPHVAIIGSTSKKERIEIANKVAKNALPYELPIIFLLNQEEEEDLIGLEKKNLVRIMRQPVTPNEIMIMVRELLRKATPVFLDKILSYKDISLDLYTMKVSKGKNVYSFGPTEFKILQLLIQRPSTIYTRRQIIDYVWGNDKEIADRTIDVHINRIRTMLKVNEDRNPLIKTIRAAGYCLD